MNPCLGLSGSCAASSYKIHRAPPAVAPSPLSLSLDSFYYFTSRLSTTCVAKNILQSVAVCSKKVKGRDVKRNTKHAASPPFSIQHASTKSPSLLHHGEHTPIKQKSERGRQKKASRERPAPQPPLCRRLCKADVITRTHLPWFESDSYRAANTSTSIILPTIYTDVHTTHPSTSGCRDLYRRQHHATKHYRKTRLD